MKVRFDLCQRSVRTEAQARRGRSQRLSNVRGAFVASSESRGERVVLIDDVVTTGSTVDECAAALDEAGATILGAACVALARRP
jgi:predicted amidophosphoribosyltransferase